jgi:hypothetical protein
VFGGYYSVDYYGIEKMFVKDSFAYLACSHDGIKIINIANPSSPFLTGQFNFFNDRDIEVLNDFAFAATLEGLGIADISNPSQPQIISHWDKCPIWVNSVGLTEYNSTILGCYDGVWLIDISSLHTP